MERCENMGEIKEKLNFSVFLKSRRGKVIIICAAILGVLACIAIMFFRPVNNVGHGDDDPNYGSGASIMFVDVGDDTYIYVDEKPVLKIDKPHQVYRSGDNNVCYITGFKNELYIFMNDGVKTIEVENPITYVQVSSDSVEALLEDDERNLYYCDGEKVEKVASFRPEEMCLSADGESYAYSSNNKTSYVYCGNKVRIYGACVLRNIADDGTSITVLKGGERHSDPDGPDVWYEGGEIVTIDKYGNQTVVPKDTDTNTDTGKSIVAKTKDGEELYVKDYKTYVKTKDNESIMVLDGSVYEAMHPLNKTDELDTLVGLVCYSKYTNIGYVMTEDYQLKAVIEECQKLYDVDDKSEKIIYESVNNKLCVVDNIDAPQKHVLNDYPYMVEMSSDGKVIQYIVNTENGSMEFHHVDEEYNDKIIIEFKDYSDIYYIDKGIYITADNVNYLINNEEVVKLEQQGTVFYEKISGNYYCYNSSGIYRLDGEKVIKLEGDIENIDYVETVGW